ncbi:MAG: molecular chaperone Tir, partial [Syntrophales bacterium]
ESGMLQGQGTMTRPDGQYVGQFKSGKKNGQGTINFVNGAKYVGQFRNDEYHGQGTLTLPTGEKYVGEWKDGKFTEVS